MKILPLISASDNTTSWLCQSRLDPGHDLSFAFAFFAYVMFVDGGSVDFLLSVR
jgi:hypothetical protein